MTANKISKLVDKLTGYQTKIVNVLTELNAAKDETILDHFKSDKNYKIFRHKIQSIKAIRNSEHYSELHCQSCRDGDGNLTNTLRINFKNGSYCKFEIDIDHHDEYEFTINDVGEDEDIIESVKTVVEELGMNVKYAKNLLQLMLDIIDDQNLSMDHDLCGFPTIDSDSDSE